jgi:glycosyltransferase involved in cell wall biosynthesis
VSVVPVVHDETALAEVAVPRLHPLDRLASAQERHPWAFALVAYLLAALAVPLLLQLRLRPGIVSLLPSGKPSVRDLETAGSRVGGLSTLTVAILSEDRDALQRFARDLVPRLNAIPGHGIRSVDWSVSAFADFVREHRGLYADLEDLRDVRDGLADRLDYERSKRNPLIVYMGDEPEDPKALVDRLRQRAEERRDGQNRFPSGFFLHPTRGLLAVFVRTDIEEGDANAAEQLIAAVNREVAALGPSRYAADLHVDFSGSLLMARDERDAMENELALAGYAGRLLPHKGIDVLMEAARLAMRRTPSLHLVVLGGNPTHTGRDVRAELSERAASWGLADRIHLPGWVGDVERALAGLDVAVVPSTCRECCSRALIESLVLGIPVVATRIGGNPELLPGDPEGLADALVTLATDAARRGDMAARALEERRRFDSQAVARRAAAVLRTAAAGSVRLPDAWEPAEVRP